MFTHRAPATSGFRPSRMRGYVVPRIAAALTLAATALIAGPAPADLSNNPNSIIQSQPIGMEVNPQSATGGTSVTASITVSSSGGSVQVGCDRPDLVSSPTGAWPYSLAYASGGPTTQYQQYHTASVSSTTYVHFYTCPAGVDASDPDNWSTYTTLTVTH